MDSLNSLIALHEANERLKEIHELKGNLPELLTQKKIELDDINKNDAVYDYIDSYGIFVLYVC